MTVMPLSYVSECSHTGTEEGGRGTRVHYHTRVRVRTCACACVRVRVRPLIPPTVRPQEKNHRNVNITIDGME